MPEADITSRHNPRLKRFLKLREGRERRHTGQLLVDGAREVLRALQSGVSPVEALLDVSCDTDRTGEALAELNRLKVPVTTVASEPFAKLAFGDRADGLILLAEAATHSLDELVLPDYPLIAVVEGVEKPGNLGAILRTADGAGIDAVIVADSQVDLYNPNTIRASIGTVFRKGIAVCSAQEASSWLKQQEVPVFVATPEATVPYYAANLSSSAAVVLGSEAFGVSEVWRNEDVNAISLPMLGVGDSLNVSATAAILFYEARRQRQVAR